MAVEQGSRDRRLVSRLDLNSLQIETRCVSEDVLGLRVFSIQPR